MKKKINSKCKVAAIFSIAILGLTACGPAVNENEVTKGTQVIETTTIKAETTPETTTPEQVTQETTTTMQEQLTGYDINGKLESTKQEVEELKKQLMGETVTQADMNQISYEISALWNETLDYVWLALGDYVDEATWETLSKEQQEWTQNKLDEVALAGSDFEGGSMQVMVECDTDASLTEERVYELLKYFK